MLTRPPSERAHAGAAVAADVLAVEAELRQAAHERPGELLGLPVLVDRGQDLLVDEAPGGDEVLPLLVVELVAHLEVVGRERLAEMGVREGLRRHRSFLSAGVQLYRTAPPRGDARRP
jgi:hypothetical protein